MSPLQVSPGATGFAPSDATVSDLTVVLTLQRSDYVPLLCQSCIGTTLSKDFHWWFVRPRPALAATDVAVYVTETLFMSPMMLVE